MNINCKNCIPDVESYLSNVPAKWRTQIAESICKYIICNESVLPCDQVTDCETLTTLSDFTITGTSACITYVDEHNVSVERCFDFSEFLNTPLDNLNPQCLATQEEWNAMTYTERWQTLIDRVCSDCED